PHKYWFKKVHISTGMSCKSLHTKLPLAGLNLIIHTLLGRLDTMNKMQGRQIVCEVRRRHVMCHVFCKLMEEEDIIYFRVVMNYIVVLWKYHTKLISAALPTTFVHEVTVQISIHKMLIKLI